MTFERYLNPREVSEILGISRSNVYKMIERKELVTLRIGKSVRIKGSDLQKFIDVNTSR
jgi:DNA binding domain, excisionase family